MKAVRKIAPATAPDGAREFSRHVAHELKSYLANVRHSADLLAEGLLGPLSAPQQEVAQILRQNSLKLQWLIEYLLTYHAWNGTATRARLGLRDLVERCAQRVQVLAQLRRIRLTVDAPGAEVVALDGTAVSLLLDNLLSHALKAAADGGGVTVSARVEAGAALIEVRDDGSPAPAEARDGLLSQFDDEPLGARDGRRAARGGLAVARACAAAHGGSIEFVDVSRGGCVRARLPAQAGDARAA